MKKNGVEEDRGFTLTSHIQTHANCDLSEGECDGTTSYVGTLVSDPTNAIHTGSSTWTYKIHEDGKKLTTTTLQSTFDGVSTPCTTGCVVVFDVVEMTKDRYVLSSTDSNGDVWVRTHLRL